jgi:AmmeMemoRadiSam system protein A
MRRLSPAGRDTLLRLARASLEDALGRPGALSIALDGLVLEAEIEERRSAFVSLKQPGERSGGPERLRGCIGSLACDAALYRAVIDVARKAGLEDPRFAPLSLDELRGTRIEISALGPLSRIAGEEDLVIGRDGVALRKGDASAVFLPQVAAELGWTAAELLRQLALKAGLPADGWRGSEISSFEAEVFGEARAG